MYGTVAPARGARITLWAGRLVKASELGSSGKEWPVEANQALCWCSGLRNS